MSYEHNSMPGEIISMPGCRNSMLGEIISMLGCRNSTPRARARMIRKSEQVQAPEHFSALRASVR